MSNLNNIQDWLLLHESLKYPLALSNNDAFKYAIAFKSNDLSYVKKKLLYLFKYTYPYEVLNDIILNKEFSSKYSTNLAYLETKNFDIIYYDYNKNIKFIKFDYFVNNMNLVINSQMLELIKSEIATALEYNKKLIYINKYKNSIRETVLFLDDMNVDKIFMSLVYINILKNISPINNLSNDMNYELLENILRNQINIIYNLWNELFVNNSILLNSQIVGLKTTFELKIVLQKIEHIFPNLYDLLTVNF